MTESSPTTEERKKWMEEFKRLYPLDQDHMTRREIRRKIRNETPEETEARVDRAMENMYAFQAARGRCCCRPIDRIKSLVEKAESSSGEKK